MMYKKYRRLISFFIILFMIQNVFFGYLVNAESDGTAPFVESLEITPNEVNVGETVTIKAKVTDDVSGVRVVTVKLSTPSGNRFEDIKLTYNETTDMWEGSYIVQSTDEAGNWEIYYIAAHDNAGNLELYYKNDFLNVEKLGFHINNSNGDGTAPIVESLEITPNEVNVGETVTIKAKVTDDISGVRVVTLKFSTPSGNRFEDVKLIYNATTDMWEGSYTVLSTDETGQWELYYIAAHDHAGNLELYYKDDFLNQDLTFTVVNTVNNSIVDSLIISSNDVSVGESVNIKVDIADQVTEADSVTLSFRSPTEDQVMEMFLVYNTDIGLWEGDTPINSSLHTGWWSFYNINVRDQSGNDYTYYYNEIDLSEYGFTVHNNNQTLTIKSLDVKTNPSRVGEQIKIEANFADDILPSNHVEVNYLSPSNNKTLSIDMVYNELSDLWEGTYTVNQYDETGIWEFYRATVMDYENNNRLYLYDKDNFSFGTSILEIVNEEGDNQPPLVNSIDVSPNEGLQVGENVFINANITDDISGVRAVMAGFQSPSKTRTKYVYLAYNQETQLWEGSYKVTAEDEKGQWNLHLIDMFDNADNHDTVYDLSIIGKISFNIVDVENQQNNNAPSSSYYLTTVNETWSDKVIGKDLYIGPNSVITVNRYVTIYGNVYVYGALKSYGDLTIHGILNAKNVTWGSGGTLYNGHVQILGGTNNISSTSVTSQPYEVPFEIQSKNFIKETDSYQVIGKTLPFIEMNVNGNPVFLDNDGSFEITINNIQNNELTFELVDVFGNVINKYITIIDEEVLANYSEAQWYYNLGNLYNAVYYAGRALLEGDIRPEVKIFIDEVSSKLFTEAATMSEVESKNSYKLLIETDGVPLEIKTEAENLLVPQLISAKFGDAQWYYGKGNLYNAVYFAGQALIEGDTRQEVKDFMVEVSTNLLTVAAKMSEFDGENAYKLLSETEGVPLDVKTQAYTQLVPEIKSAKYGDAQWYYSHGNLYNAVYYAGQALMEGDNRQEVIDFMVEVSTNLLTEAATMSEFDSSNAYNLLVKTEGVPLEVKTQAKNQLVPKIESVKYGDAQWYYSQGNLYNAIYFVGQALLEGDTRPEVTNFMIEVSKYLFEQAGTMNYVESYNAYQILVNTEGVPIKIKESAEEMLLQ